MPKITLIFTDKKGETKFVKDIEANHVLRYGDFVGTAGFGLAAEQVGVKLPTICFVKKVVITYLETQPKWSWQPVTREEAIQVECQI
jgi:hypothetical protein